MDLFNEIGTAMKKAWDGLAKNKAASIVVLALLILLSATVVIAVNKEPAPVQTETGEEQTATKETETKDASETETEEGPVPGSSSTTTTTTAPTTTTKPPVTTTKKKNPDDWKYNNDTYPVTVTPPEGTNYVFRTDIDMDDNIFMDSLAYTGYNVAKHRQDGEMWNYILSTDKRWRGWLTDIGYDYDGNTSGYETNAEGLPDIQYFIDNDMVCASYIAYVYFNYIPNVVGTDVSALCKPQNSMLANDWYKTAKQWVLDGYSVQIPFKAKLNGGFIQFTPETEIPIGSLLFFCDAKNKSDWSTHVCIYAGYRNNNHWVYHVGNDNGPEFCSVERMHFGPDPQWPIGVFATPSMIEFK